MNRRATWVLLVGFATVPWLLAMAPAADSLGVPKLPDEPFKYADADIDLPAHYVPGRRFGNVGRSDNTPRNNPITNEGATLGRVLFYDKRLSANDTVACGSCHLQEYGFTDPKKLSEGFKGEHTKRRAMPIVNIRYSRGGRMFWDVRARTLEEQVLMPIQDPIEMGMTLDDLLVKLTATDFYGPLFEDAFGTPEITTDRISKALAQFVRSLVSYQSKFDKALVPGPGGFPLVDDVLTPQEAMGWRLFDAAPRGDGPLVLSRSCYVCHATVAQMGGTPRNTGLDSTTVDEGAGSGRFKAPSLRNVAVRSSFMHDGRFSTLREVIEHYNDGVEAHPSLDGRLIGRDGKPKKLGLTEEEIDALVAFLKSLTDETFLTDPKFSDPFVE